MAKIIKKDAENVTVGLDNGTFEVYPLSSCNGQVVPHQVNKIAYVLLCFFFGGIGIHKFYAGHWILGLLYLIFLLDLYSCIHCIY